MFLVINTNLILFLIRENFASTLHNKLSPFNFIIMNSTQKQSTKNTKYGNIRTFIDQIIYTYAKEDELIRKVIESRLLLNGIRITEYNNDTPDDTQVLIKLDNIEKELAKVFS